jgi:hypothetical protein
MDSAASRLACGRHGGRSLMRVLDKRLRPAGSGPAAGGGNGRVAALQRNRSQHPASPRTTAWPAFRDGAEALET